MQLLILKCEFAWQGRTHAFNFFIQTLTQTALSRLHCLFLLCQRSLFIPTFDKESCFSSTIVCVQRDGAFACHTLLPFRARPRDMCRKCTVQSECPVLLESNAVYVRSEMLISFFFLCCHVEVLVEEASPTGNYFLRALPAVVSRFRRPKHVEYALVFYEPSYSMPQMDII